MSSSVTRVSTDRASRYLQQMCKHFAHKLEVEFDEVNGRIEFPFGYLDMAATTAALTLTVTASEDDDALAKMEKVTADHLVRFMFREDPKIDWTRAK